MTQADLNRQVAKATGESVGQIGRMGFSIADLAQPQFDPEPFDFGQCVDWDLPDQRRHLLLPVR